MNQERTAPKPSQKAKSAGRFRAFFSRLVRCAIWLALAAYVFSYFGQHFFFAEILSNFRFQFWMLFAVATVASFAMRFNLVLKVACSIAVIWASIETAQVFVPAGQPAAGKTSFRIMSYNVFAANTRFGESIGEIRKHDPDIVAVIECANQWHDALDGLKEEYPFQLREPRWHGYGIAIFSKFPLDSKTTIQLSKDVMDNPAIIAVANVEGQKFRFMAAHVMSPTNQFRLNLRNRQFAEIAKAVNEGDDAMPTILVGDLNCTPSSSFLQNLMRETLLRDSRRGFGIHGSWPSFAPPLAIPIDHALVSESVRVESRFLGNGHGSDHCPVILDVSFGPKQ